ncbi:hypothetical protein [Allomuricauda sp. SCSIO 65647]|uniref:hypothetical protein n=1 Tax=Allomuricauda sp. SCSIO 65647 TaxID=2908843 RepID=UPI001F233C59|nr:hypothetical protein [Muricauda sp. SCSIO 65647]UJH69114.1 hypothetical protein L0P89_07845 [Muricauda sp. SCSIO 65647]
MTRTVLVISKFVALAFFLVSCGDKNLNKEKTAAALEERNSHEIYSLLINNHEYFDYVGLLPPPPATFTEDFTEKDFWRLRDSLKAIHQDSLLRIAIYPEFFHTDPKDNTQSTIKDSTFSNLYEKLVHFKRSTIDISKLTYDENRIKLSLLDTIRNNDKWKRRFKNNHIILSFSRVAFSENFDKALVVSGVTISKYDGFSSTIRLKKEDGKWKVLDSLQDDVRVMYDLIMKNNE